MTAAPLARAVLLVWSAGYSATVAWGLAAMARRDRARAARSSWDGAAPSVLVVRPCAGDEPHLEETLGSLRADALTLAATVRIAVACADDPALPRARAAVDALDEAGLDAKVVVTGARAPNAKADQIARVIAEAPAFDVLAVVDSDVRLAPGDLRALVMALRGPHVGAAYAPFVEDGCQALTFGDRLSAAVLQRSLHAFPLLSALDPAGLVGKCFAVPRTELDAVGGMRALVPFLGEDMELARRLRAHGRRVVTSTPVVAAARGRSAREAIERFTRWIAVIRAQRAPLLVSYPLLFVAPFPAALGAFALGSNVGHAAAALFLFARLALARFDLAAAVAGDAVLAIAFVRALRSRIVVWRGAHLRLDGPVLASASSSPRKAPLVGAGPASSTAIRDPAPSPVTRQDDR